MGTAEDFCRIRRKLIPVWPFDKLQEASSRRDRKSDSPSRAASPDKDAAPLASGVDIRPDSDSGSTVDGRCHKLDHSARQTLI